MFHRTLIVVGILPVLLAPLATSAAEPTSHYDKLKNLEWLVGDWKSEVKAGADCAGDIVLTQSNKWILNKNAIQCEMTVEVNGMQVYTAVTTISWNASKKQAFANTVNSTGGSGQGVVSVDGKKFYLIATFVEHSGVEGSDTTMFSDVAKDSFASQQINIIRGGANSPDKPKLTWNRVKG